MDRAAELRQRLADAHLYLLFTPHLVKSGEPLEVLEAVLPFVDVVQVRPKTPDRELDRNTGSAAKLIATDARELYELCRRVIERVEALRPEVLVIANDRVDVARSLLARGLAGVHLGREDAPPRIARALLGPEALIGYSTHSMAQVGAALEESVDYLGFGPIAASATKGYERGHGTELAWVAGQASTLPLFPIGGIGLAEAGELNEIGRAAVSSAILAADDPAAAAAAIRAVLED